MKGNNELHLNGATMQRIVQEWIDREIKPKPQVSHIAYNGNVFVVKLSDPTQPAA